MVWSTFITRSLQEYPVVSIEDGFDQDDWENWGKLMTSTSIQLVSKKATIVKRRRPLARSLHHGEYGNHTTHHQVGDDLTVTNPKRIQMAVEKKSCNCLLLKVDC